LQRTGIFPSIYKRFKSKLAIFLVNLEMNGNDIKFMK
jgi:hypothetical protein